MYNWCHLPFDYEESMTVEDDQYFHEKFRSQGQTQFGFEESTNCCCIGLPRRTTPVDCVLLTSHHTLVKVRFELH